MIVFPIITHHHEWINSNCTVLWPAPDSCALPGQEISAPGQGLHDAPGPLPFFSTSGLAFRQSRVATLWFSNHKGA
jgi:hypothetical protein